MKRVLASFLLALAVASAHRLDEYLQATLIGVTRHGVDVEISLTPGVAVLPTVLAAIDSDRDGRISAAEAQAYADRVTHDVELRIDGHNTALSIVESKFPPIEEMPEGLGAIRLKLHTDRIGREVQFDNRHLPKISAYLVNCLDSPGAGLTLGPPQRDEAQRSIRFDYSFAPATHPKSAPAVISILLLTVTAFTLHRHFRTRTA